MGPHQPSTWLLGGGWTNPSEIFYQIGSLSQVVKGENKKTLSRHHLGGWIDQLQPWPWLNLCSQLAAVASPRAPIIKMCFLLIQPATAAGLLKGFEVSNLTKSRFTDSRFPAPENQQPLKQHHTGTIISPNAIRTERGSESKAGSYIQEVHRQI